MFIDEGFGAAYYKKLPLGYHNEASFCFGQIFWTHAYYPHENLELWRAVLDPAEPTKTIASQFRITPAGQDAYERRSDRWYSFRPSFRWRAWIIVAIVDGFNGAERLSPRFLGLQTQGLEHQ